MALRAPGGAREAADFARELTRHRLGELGHLLDCPFTWDDLVLPDWLRQALEDFAFERATASGSGKDPRRGVCFRAAPAWSRC